MFRHVPSTFVVALLVTAMIATPASRVGAQTAPSAPASDVVTPLPSNTPPASAPAPALNPTPAQPAAGEPPPSLLAAPPPRPFYKRYWFWSVVGVVALTATVILAASTGPDRPVTTLGNMRAF